jgi:hypothetical protein
MIEKLPGGARRLYSGKEAPCSRPAAKHLLPSLRGDLVVHRCSLAIATVPRSVYQ